MQAIFGIGRERDHNLFLADYRIRRADTFHFHSPVELVQVTRGTLEVWINGKQYILQEGEAAIATSYQTHVYNSVNEEGALATVLCIPTELCEDFITLSAGKRLSTHIRDKKTLKKISFALLALHDRDLNAVEQRGYVGMLLGAILHHTETEAEGEELNSSMLSKALLYINDNYKEDISLASISAALGYSSHYVAKQFRTCFRITLGQYITTVRLKNAVILLRNNKMNVTDCALESGFSSTRTFYRAFFSEFKCTPREYIKSAQADAAL